MSRYDLLATAISGADRDSDDILSLFGASEGAKEYPRYSAHARRRNRARRTAR